MISISFYENETLFIFAACYGFITAQSYEIVSEIGNKPISKIENITENGQNYRQAKKAARTCRARRTGRSGQRTPPVGSRTPEARVDLGGHLRRQQENEDVQVQQHRGKNPADTGSCKLSRKQERCILRFNLQQMLKRGLHKPV